MRHRLPWPWEGQPDPLEGAAKVDLSRLVVLPDGDVRPGAVVASGEILASRTRDTRDQLARHILDHTDGTPAAREWAERKAATAAQRWDRGVRDGSIPRPT